MKIFFYTGLIAWIVFEFLKAYFVMPFPGSQQINSIDLAYFLYSYRWMARVLFVLIILAGTVPAFRIRKKWAPLLVLLFAAFLIFLINSKVSADKMFLQAQNIILKPQAENRVPGSRLVLGVAHGGEAKAYPVELLAYHHQVLDRIGGKQMMITYCSVCRSGRVYEPVVNGRPEKFRLVGMDHFNAMFEDASTGSWWRQATGEAIAGTLKGKRLTEIGSMQVTVNKWYELYPDGKVMQPDETFLQTYDSLARFEQGLSKGHLTRTERMSWKDKSWIVGLNAGNSYKAYDWNDLVTKKIIHDTIGQVALILALSSDGQSFAAFERPADKIFTLERDTLCVDGASYDFSGRNLTEPSKNLQQLVAVQEFWHSWLTFHPNTLKYQDAATKTN